VPDLVIDRMLSTAWRPPRYTIESLIPGGGTMIRTGVITLAAVASLALVAGADTLRLRNGGAVEGRVTETDTGYVLRTEPIRHVREGRGPRVDPARTALEDILDAIATLPRTTPRPVSPSPRRARAAGCESTALDLLRQTLRPRPFP